MTHARQKTYAEEVKQRTLNPAEVTYLIRYASRQAGTAPRQEGEGRDRRV